MKAKIWLLTLSLFTLATLFMSSSVIFDIFGIREREGNYVNAVVWANFLAGILYLFSLCGAVRNAAWGRQPLAWALVVLFLAYIALGVHIASGGLYETKTVGAMAFRIALTSVFLFTYKKLFLK